MNRRLSVEADLDVSVDGHRVAVRGSGSRLTVEVEDARTAWRLFQSRRPGRRLVRAVTDTLDALGIDVDVVVGGRHVATAGPGAVAGRVGRAMGLPNVQAVGPLVEGGPAWALVGLAFFAGVAVGARR